MRSNITIILLFSISLLLSANVIAQEKATTPKDTTYWQYEFSHGLNIMQLAMINPRIGNGVDMLNFGGDIGFNFSYDSEKIYWTNNINWQFGVQRIGSGTLPGGGSIPWTKSLDLLTYNSTLGVPFKPNGTFYYGGYIFFLSQGTPTYEGNLLVDNTTDNSGTIISKLFSPARLQVAPAISYFSKDKKIQFSYSPISYQSIMVFDDAIAALGVHGNPVERVNGAVVSFENVDNQLGSFLLFGYNDAYANNKLTLRTNITLYSNYLNDPERVDVNWNADIGATIFKKIQIALKLNLFYDYDTDVLISDSSIPFTDWELGKKVSFTQQLILRYRVTF